MNENAASLAALNVSLLQAIADGPVAGPKELAERAGLIPTNINRKVDSLLAAGLVEKNGEAACDVALTDLGHRGLAAMDVWRGDASRPAAATAGDTIFAPFHLIDPWPRNPRTQFDDATTEALAQSVADNGVLQPLVVRVVGDRYQVIIGERRRRASTLAVQRGWAAPNFLVPVRIREMTDDEAYKVAVAENTQREDLHWMDEAKSFLELAAMGLSAAQIERLVGGARGKRSIQDYTKIARELPPALVARAYLAEKDPQHLSYVRARDEVGEKKERPALELSPRLALTLLEVIAAGLQQQNLPDLPGLGQLVVTRFAKPPSGGPLHQLASDRKLLSFGFEGRDVVARTPLSEDVHRWLVQLAFDKDLAGAIRKARVTALGDMQAAALARGADYATTELNLPPQAEPESAPGPDVSASQRRVLRDIAARSIHRHRLLDGWVRALPSALDDPDYTAVYDLEFTLHRSTADGLEIALTRAGLEWLKSQKLAPEDGKSPNSCATPWLRTDAPAAAEQPTPQAPQPSPDIFDDDAREDEHEDEDESLTPTVNQAPTPSSKPAGDEFDLPPMLAMVVIELAHKISASGLERGPGTWAAEIRESYYRDARIAQLVQGRRAMAVMPLNRDKTLATLTVRCLDWLEAKHRIHAENGRPMIGDAALSGLQQDLGFKPEDDGPYSTYWLNGAAPAAAPPAEPPPEVPSADAAPLAPPRRDVFMQQILDVTAPARAITRLSAALREARTHLQLAISRKLTAQEVAKLESLFDSALAQAEAATPAQSEVNGPSDE